MNFLKQTYPYKQHPYKELKHDLHTKLAFPPTSIPKVNH